LQAHDVDEQLGRNINAIFESIRQERIVMLKGYSSGQRREKTDRLVEAYAFLPGNKEVRCFELTSRMNKTFNLTRVDEVELLDAPWRFATEHRPITTDLFHFSGEARHRVVLRLGRLAHNLLLEEVPAAEDLLQAEEGDTWLLDAEYCSMKGVGRFVLGLLDDIEVVDSPDFVDYLRAQLILFTNRLNAHPAALPHPVDE
ncbi:MAG: WYL domain-containing protein, partial [Bacteroidaceae bacterium]|nr:WYL domain-containing protein [Bacteroidaceae bacterium]